STHVGGSYGFTIEAWVQATESASGYVAALASSGSAVNYGITVTGGDAGLVARRGNGSQNLSGAGVVTGTSDWFSYDSNVAVDDGAWHYLAAVFSLDTDNDDDNDAGEEGADDTPYKTELYIDPSDATP